MTGHAATPEPVLRVVEGRPDPDELAALLCAVAVLRASARRPQQVSPQVPPRPEGRARRRPPSTDGDARWGARPLPEWALDRPLRSSRS